MVALNGAERVGDEGKEGSQLTAMGGGQQKPQSKTAGTFLRTLPPHTHTHTCARTHARAHTNDKEATQTSPRRGWKCIKALKRHTGYLNTHSLHTFIG